MRAVLLAALLVSALGGCAGTIQHTLQRESARAIEPTPNPDSVTLSDVHRDVLGNWRRWVATTPNGVYDCSKEAAEKHALCAKRQ